MATRPLLLLIDGSHAVFRAFFAVRGLTSPVGQPTGAVFGFVSMLQKLLRDRQPAKIAACFDTSAPTFRHELDPNYKANRPDMPPDLQIQWPIAQRVCVELGVPLLVLPGMEADDLIATLAIRGRKAGHDVLIVSGDKDLMQLVVEADGDQGWIRQLDDGKGLVYTPKQVEEKWGVGPDRVGDLLAIMGDSSDNIPGVKGIGEKGAVKLLQQWGTLDGIYANIDRVEPARAQQLLRDSADAAKLARQMVALDMDAQLPWQLDDLKRQPDDRDALAKTFAELGFKRLQTEFTDVPAGQEQQLQFEILTDFADIQGVAEQIRLSRQVAIATVTSQADPERLQPMWGNLVGIGLSWTPRHVAYIPLQHVDQLGGRELGQTQKDEVLRILKPVLENPQIGKIGHHSKYDALVLRRHGVQVRGWIGDVQLASYVHDAERYTHSLRNIASGLSNVILAAEDELLGKGKNQTGWDKVPVDKAAAHVAQRAALIWQLHALLLPLLDEVQVRSIYSDLEIPLADVLEQMEWNGIRVEPEELAKQSLWLASEIAAEEAQIHELAGQKFNVGSPSQLGDILFVKLALPAKKKTQTGYSTDQSVLEALDHPIAAKVLRYRQLAKLKGTYTDALPEMILPLDLRIHTCFAQAVASTGRLSSIEPNLQNIPIRSQEGKRIRQAFVAAENCILMSADYSQIELRVMAHMADEPTMQSAFVRGMDIHRETAAQIFGIMPGLVTSEQRSAAKTINFGILYGMGPQRLAREIGVSLKEAKAFIERYFANFSGVKTWVEKTLADANVTGEVRTLFGRRRTLPGLKQPPGMERAAAERVAVNTPVQGTAADLIKIAMIAVQKQLNEGNFASKLLLQVHDELVLEVPNSEVEAVTELVRNAMEGAGILPDGTPMKVPLRVDLRCGHSWADAH